MKDNENIYDMLARGCSLCAVAGILIRMEDIRTEEYVDAPKSSKEAVTIRVRSGLKVAACTAELASNCGLVYPNILRPDNVHIGP